MTDTNTYEDIYNLLGPILSTSDRPKPLSYDGIVKLWTLVDIPMNLTKSAIKLIKCIYVPFNDKINTIYYYANINSLFMDYGDNVFTTFINERIIDDPINYFNEEDNEDSNYTHQEENVLYYLIGCHLVVLKEYLLIHNITDNKLVNILNCTYLYENVVENLTKEHLYVLSDSLKGIVFKTYIAQFYMPDDIVLSKYKNYDQVIKKSLTDVNMTKNAKELILIFANKKVYLKQDEDYNRKNRGLLPLIKSYTKYINTNIEKILNNLITTNKINELDVIEAIVFNGEDIFSD